MMNLKCWLVSLSHCLWLAWDWSLVLFHFQLLRRFMPSPKISNNNQAGSLLIELSIALAIFSLALTVFSSVMFTRQIYALQLHIQTTALPITISNLSAFKTRAEQNIFSDALATSTDLASSSLTHSYLTPCIVEAEAKSSWHDSIFHTISLSTEVLDTHV